MDKDPKGKTTYLLYKTAYLPDTFRYCQFKTSHCLDKITDCRYTFRYCRFNVRYLADTFRYCQFKIHYCRFNICYLVNTICYRKINVCCRSNKTIQLTDKIAYILNKFPFVGYSFAHPASQAHWQAHKTHRTKANLPKSLPCPTLHSHK